jgi:phosphoglycolate phosphatase
MTEAGALEPQSPWWRRNANRAQSSRQTIFCDLDGPLIDVSDRYYQTYRLGLARTHTLYQSRGTILPIQALSKSQFWQMKQDRTPDIEIAMRSGLQAEEIDFFLTEVRQLVNQPILLEKDQLQPGVRWSLAILYACGYRLAVVTLRRQAQAVELLRKHELAHFFTAIYGTQDDLTAYHNYTESKTQLLTQVLVDYPLNPGERAWMIGDTEADVLAGQALGVATIALTCGIRSLPYLHGLRPTLIYNDLLSASQYLLGLPQLVQA